MKAKRVQYRQRRTETNTTYNCLAHVSTAQSMINHLELRIIMPLDGIQYLTLCSIKFLHTLFLENEEKTSETKNR